MSALAPEKSPHVEIDVGGLRNLQSFVSRTGKQLREYTRLYRAGASPEVVWDLRGCIPKQMSMATLTAFLSIADRLREYSGRAQRARVKYDPKVLQFLDDIDFIALVEDLDLFEWEPANSIGGYNRGVTNPDTKILAFSVADEAPPRTDETAWIKWKDGIRDRLRNQMLLHCGPLFHEARGAVPFASDLPNVVANTCAELVLNASLWGPSDSFVGLQRTRDRISAAVCDTGKGYLASAIDKRVERKHEIENLYDDVHAIIYSSLTNRQEFGLRRAITSVVERQGWVSMSSVGGIVKWKSASWRRAVAAFDDDSTIVPSADSLFPKRTELQPLSEDTLTGYARQLKPGLRGVRVSFEIPVHPSFRRI